MIQERKQRFCSLPPSPPLPRLDSHLVLGVRTAPQLNTLGVRHRDEGWVVSALTVVAGVLEHLLLLPQGSTKAWHPGNDADATTSAAHRPIMLFL